MPDLLIRNIDACLKRRLKLSARRQGRSLSEEAKLLLRKALAKSPERKMGTALLRLVPKKYRGDELIFEFPGEVSLPAHFSRRNS
jgi:plasmid stability protein